MRWIAFSFLFAVATAAMPVAAQQAATQSPLDIEAIIDHGLAPGQRLHRFVENAPLLFHMFDGDRDGAITEADRKNSLQMYATMERAPLIGQFLRADFDGDGTVTRDELERYITYLSRLNQGGPPEAKAKRDQGHANWVAAQLRADANGDGRIDWNEMVAHARRLTVKPRINIDSAFEVMLGFDIDRDGKTTLAEFIKALEARFAAIDADQDGVVSKDEFEAHWQKAGRPAPKVATIQPTFEEQRAEACKLPRPPKDAEVLLLTMQSGLGLSTAALGSDDDVTTTTRVTIEPGRKPLYVILITSRPMIWQFDGATERLSRVVLYAGSPYGGKPTPAGATGIPREIITFAAIGNCTQFWVNLHARSPEQTKTYLRLLIGRSADTAFDLDRVWNLRLPSGQSADSDQEFRRALGDDDGPTSDLSKLRRAFLASFPGALVAINPADVVSEQPVKTYDVLPEYAGLLQLMRDGAISLNRSGEFLVRKPMRFPPGLSGAHSAKFLVLKGVPTPTGSPGHSTVISEETGEPLCPKGICIRQN